MAMQGDGHEASSADPQPAPQVPETTFHRQLLSASHPERVLCRAEQGVAQVPAEVVTHPDGQGAVGWEISQRSIQLLSIAFHMQVLSAVQLSASM